MFAYTILKCKVPSSIFIVYISKLVMVLPCIYLNHFYFQVPGYPAWYNIVYIGDEAVYTYQLMKDYKEGGLKLTIA